MDDSRIIEMYLNRSENAIAETAKKFGKYCHTIAFNILRNREDSEECVNDTYMRAWNSIPPHNPNRLSTFLGKITRNLALNKHEKISAKKRGMGQVPLALDELTECIPDTHGCIRTVEDSELADIFNRFLSRLPADTRKVFVQRYWYLCSVKEIASHFGFSESKVKMLLLRTRNELKQALEKEGVML